MFANDRKAVEALFSQIDQLAVSSDGIDDALDLVYLEFDRWMERGLTHRLELVFALADPERWDLSIAIGLLSASLPMADTIKARAWFLEGAIGVSCDAGLDVHRLFGGL